MINPEHDGIYHINIYSRGKTEFGRMLSNFYKFPIITTDGNFESVEGYWYWLNIEDCPEKEELRTLYGFYAKRRGLEILQYKNCRWDSDFEVKIKKAIWYKFERNTHLLKKEYFSMPLEHYFISGGCVKNAKQRYPWMINAITNMIRLFTE
jgi:predicted NAD-dependent protein-ADP-ribosyltransferase YbiA (DUF1768 family)